MTWTWWDPISEYKTNRRVKVHSYCLGLTLKISWWGVAIGYIFFYSLIYNEGYMKKSSAFEPVIVAKVIGAVDDMELLAPKADPFIRDALWDHLDIVTPQEGVVNEGIFVATNIGVTDNQTRGRCFETTLHCQSKADCQSGSSRLTPSGRFKLTGNCGGTNETHKTCEVIAWCPIPSHASSWKPGLLVGTKNFTLHMKSSVHITSLGNSHHYTGVHATNFSLGYIVEKSTCGLNTTCVFDNVAKRGGIFSVHLKWTCKFAWFHGFLDSDQTCTPTYHFEKEDDFWNFGDGNNELMYSSAIYESGGQRRTEVDKYGIKIIFLVDAQGREFSPMALLFTVGAGLGYLTLGRTVCEFILSLMYEKKSTPWIQRLCGCLPSVEKFDVYHTGLMTKGALSSQKDVETGGHGVSPDDDDDEEEGKNDEKSQEKMLKGHHHA